MPWEAHGGVNTVGIEEIVKWEPPINVSERTSTHSLKDDVDLREQAWKS